MPQVCRDTNSSEMFRDLTWEEMESAQTAKGRRPTRSRYTPKAKAKKSKAKGKGKGRGSRNRKASEEVTTEVASEGTSEGTSNIIPAIKQEDDGNDADIEDSDDETQDTVFDDPNAPLVDDAIQFIEDDVDSGQSTITDIRESIETASVVSFPGQSIAGEIHNGCNTQDFSQAMKPNFSNHTFGSAYHEAEAKDNANNSEGEEPSTPGGHQVNGYEANEANEPPYDGDYEPNEHNPPHDGGDQRARRRLSVA